MTNKERYEILKIEFLKLQELKRKMRKQTNQARQLQIDIIILKIKWTRKGMSNEEMLIIENVIMEHWDELGLCGGKDNHKKIQANIIDEIEMLKKIAGL